MSRLATLSESDRQIDSITSSAEAVLRLLSVMKDKTTSRSRFGMASRIVAGGLAA